MLDPWIDNPSQPDAISRPKNEGDNHPVMSNPGQIIGYDANGNPIRGQQPGKAGPSGPGPGGGGSPFGGSGSGNSIIDTYMGTGTAPATGAGAVSTTGTTAGILGSSLKWGDIINAALAIYSLHKADQTPNFYPVPPSPSETYRLDKTKSLYDFASGYTEQYLKGLNGLNPDFKMPNNLTGNPEFMGGVKVPTIDFSKIPSMSGAPPESQAVSNIPPGITPERVKVDPNTGKWYVDNATPEEQAWLDAANRTKANVPPAPTTGGSNSYAP